MENNSNLSQTNSDEVHIYLRNSQKRAHYIRLPREVNEEQLRRTVSDKLKIVPEKLILFLKGEQLSG